MKKILSLATAFLVTLSMFGCAMGNNRINDRNRVGTNDGTDARRLSLQNNINSKSIRADALLDKVSPGGHTKKLV